MRSIWVATRDNGAMCAFYEFTEAAKWGGGTSTVQSVRLLDYTDIARAGAETKKSGSSSPMRNYASDALAK